jgi:hypothetical protein
VDIGRFAREPRSPGRVVLDHTDLGALQAADQDLRHILLEVVV